MLEGGWALYAVIAAVFSAGFYLTNQYMKQSGRRVVFWMRAMIVAVMTPFIPLLHWPQEPSFYGIVILTALFGTTADIRTMDATAKYGGGVVARVMPVTVVAAFFLWFFFAPGLLQGYLNEPLRALCICLALGGCVFFAVRLHKCEVSRAAMIYMLPALSGYTATTILNKSAMQFGDFSHDYAGVVFGYMYIQSWSAIILIGLFSGPAAIFFSGPAAAAKKLKPEAGFKKVLAAAILVSLVWIGHMTFKNYAVAYTPHPSYQAAVNLTAPVFISIIYLFLGHREKANVRDGMGIVVSVLLLVLMTVKR